MIDPSDMQPVQGRTFRFACHQSLPCFTRCCANLELVLTPHDIIRLKNRLDLSSGDFLDRYTTVSADRISGLPVVKLKMQTDEKRRCPFVKPTGCAIFGDRPGACRLYPLGRAASTLSRTQSIAEARLDRIRTDDIELTAIACRWLKFSLFGEMTLPINRHLE